MKRSLRQKKWLEEARHEDKHAVVAPFDMVAEDIIKNDTSLLAFSDMTVDEYMRSSTEWAVEITAYIKELINQITHKASYIDLRGKE